MKIAVFCLIIFPAILNLSCGQNVESSPVAATEKPAEMPPPAPTPDKFEEIDIIEQFAVGQNSPMPSIEYEGYKIKRVTVRKREELDGTLTDVQEAVLSKNGKTLARFEGTIHSLGNSMSFGLYPFLGSSQEQLLIIDESPRSDREWIVSLKPKFEILFDAADYHVEGGYLRLIDIDKDGIFELIYGKSLNLDFIYNGSKPVGMIIFKFDSKTRKYLPATHIFTDYTLNGIEEKVKNFKESGNHSVSSVLGIFMIYVYAGREDDAWKFFEQEGIDFSSQETLSAKVEGKRQIKEHIRNVLDEDPIYKFIRNDLSRQK